MTHGRIHALSLLSTKILNSCSIYDGQVGDFQVATGGGFWVAIREKLIENYCRYIKHWFTVSNIICSDQYEIDILAVEFTKDGSQRAYQIGSGVTISEGFSKLTTKSFSKKDLTLWVKPPLPRRTIGYFIEKKFGLKEVLEKIADFCLNPEDAQKVIVTWGWEAEVKEIADAHNILLWNFPDLLTELAFACAEGKTRFEFRAKCLLEPET